MKRHLLTIIFTIAIFSFLHGQDVYSLEQCIERAWEEDLTMKDAKIAIDNAQINTRTAKQSRFPSLNGGTSLSWNFGRTIDPTTNDFITTTFLSNNFSLNTGVTLFNAGRINNTIKQSDLDFKASQKDLEQTRNDIALSVATSFLNVLFAQENLENSRKQLAISQDQLIQTEQLIESGSRPENERLDIEAQIATREQAVITNQNILDISMLGLKQLLRFDPEYDMALRVPPSVDVFTDPDLLTFEEVYRGALLTQKSVEAGELRVRSSEMGIKVAKSALFPSLTFGGSLLSNYSNQGLSVTGFETVRQEQQVFLNEVPVTVGTDVDVPNLVNTPYFDQIDENISYGFGFNLSIPIYNNYRNKANVEQAKLNSLRANNTLEIVKDQIKNSVQQALADARAAKKSLEAAEKSQRASLAAYNNAEKKYELGAINTFELTSLQNQLEQAEINLIIARYDYLFRTKVLDFYMGKPIKLN